LEPKIFLSLSLSLSTILTSKPEAKNFSQYGVPLAAPYISILFTEKAKDSPLYVSANRDEKKKITCF
jgi:hypothetical protein